MTCSNPMLDETHRNARRIVKARVPSGSELCTSNWNLQMLIFYELFRQTAYAMISYGGPNLAIELMGKVIDEMRELAKGCRAKSFDKKAFRRDQDRKRNLQDWYLFRDIPYAGKVPFGDGEEDEYD